ncbi:NAD(P)H-hydrate dehydratase [Thiospirochaeta perfilievii]|uniref:Bifunctional NAD(P)H-hydrate repair enzyme n=1 Tax=Thiospirochaeta perfilievii TaxID=252967 RepID=A0A5C1QDV9_9SPIO|nr:NAD(P)H-hydrate dehydratase [Thiospirochaeta perfilievii]QEN04836.1 NAD(P)H-hydrate dehydratase [Thiospirochaeta perfilievii]
METIRILSPNQIKTVEKEAVDSYFLTEEILMESAALSVYNIIVERFKGFSVIIYCGPGNNGGDGLALGRILSNNGYKVYIDIIDSSKYNGASKRNFQAAEKLGLLENKIDIKGDKTLIVDAIFGVGLNRVIADDIQGIISSINSLQNPVISLDIPSGINGFNGKIMGEQCINSDITVTFIAPKIGLYLFPGANFCGEIIIESLSLPPALFNKLSAPRVNKPIKIKPRKTDIHKSSYGKVINISGSENYFGAPYFVSKAALLSGCGYSMLSSPPSIKEAISSIAPELVYINESDIIDSVKSSSCTVFGPGLGVNYRSKSLLKKIIKIETKNLIIDGDGLTILADSMKRIKNIQSSLILTPHPKEMSRLLGKTLDEVENSRIESALELSTISNAIVVLKGVYSVITTPQKDVYINTESSNSLATAGSGDILCGIIAGLCGYTDPLSAVKSAVYIHGKVGQYAKEQIGDFGVTANSLLSFIPEVINSHLDTNL